MYNCDMGTKYWNLYLNSVSLKRKALGGDAAQHWDPHAQTACDFTKSRLSDFTKWWQGRGTSGWDGHTIKVAWDTPAIC